MPFLPRWYGTLARLNTELGRWNEAETFIEKCMALDFERNEGRIHCDWARAWMAAHAARPDWQEAEAHATAALAQAEKQGLRPEVAMGRLDYARLLAEQGDRERAREQLAQASAMFREMGMDWWLGEADKLEGTL